MLKAILFDFDGVIGLSEFSRFKVMQRIFAEYGINLPDTADLELVGKTTRKFMEEFTLSGLTPELKEAITQAFRKEFRANIHMHVQPNTPVVRFIKNYTGDAKLVIVTGSSKEVITKMLTLFGIANKFEHIITQEDVKNTKPHPEPYQLALQKLSIKPDEAIAIEDSIVGFTSAKQAGIPTHIFLNGVNSPEHFSEVAHDGFLKTEVDIQQLIAKA